MHTFQTPQPVQLRVELWVGKIEVTASETDSTTVELIAVNGDANSQDIIDNTKVEQRGDEIVVLAPKVKGGLFRSRGEVEARIVVPVLSSAKLQSGSADIETHGQLGDVRAESGSGEVQIEHGDNVDTKTGSGDIAVERADGRLSSKSGSADVAIGTVGGNADVVSGSGDVALKEVGGVLKIKCGSGDVAVLRAGDGVDAMAGSGDVHIGKVSRGKVKAKTGSGDVVVSVVDGTPTYLDVMTVTGDVTSDLDGAEPPEQGSPSAEVQIQSGSGDVVLQRA